MSYKLVSKGVFHLVVLNYLPISCPYQVSTTIPKFICDYKKKIHLKKIKRDWKTAFVHCSNFHLLDNVGKANRQWLTYPQAVQGQSSVQVGSASKGKTLPLHFL